MIQVVTVLIDKPEVDRIDAALLVEELAEIYSTPTPNAMAKAEKIVLIECSSLFTITRV